MTVIHYQGRVVTTYRINGLIQESYNAYLFFSLVSSTHSLCVEGYRCT
jgi:hypothetical protein